jgi:UPF0755 protein
MKSSKTYSFFSRFVVLFFVVVVGAWGVWLWWSDSIGPVDAQDSSPIVFVVNSGDGVKMIAANLSSQRIIRSPMGFYLLVKMLGIERELQAGDFRLKRSMNAKEIATELTHGIHDLWVTTLEGWRMEEVASKVGKDLDIPEQEFLKYSREGYMFPDTYLIPRDATAAAIAKMFTDNFDKKITPQMREDAKKTGLTFDQVITLASIVEREGRTSEDRPMIAGILLKRLKEDWPLQVDASLQYILGYQAADKTWWKKSIFDEDKKLKSPYNTYANPGLPPKPICNPGIESINAVIYSKDSDYMYYLHDTTGAVHYGKTIEDHEANITKFLQ